MKKKNILTIIKEFIEKRGNERFCAICGTMDNLVVHHKDGSRSLGLKNMNNSPSNLMVVCRRCHAEIHYLMSGNDFGYKKLLNDIKHGEREKLMSEYKARRIEIAELYKSGMAASDISRKVGLTRERIRQILIHEGCHTSKRIKM